MRFIPEFFLGDFLELNIEQGVQECDATMKNSSNAAGLKKKSREAFSPSCDVSATLAFTLGTAPKLL
jgi:hypothetical protein